MKNRVGATLLYFVAGWGNSTLTYLFIVHRVDVNAKKIHGKTLFDYVLFWLAFELHDLDRVHRTGWHDASNHLDKSNGAKTSSVQEKFNRVFDLLERHGGFFTDEHPVLSYEHGSSLSRFLMKEHAYPQYN